MQLTTVLLLAAALLSLGPFLAVDGHLTHVPLPFWVFDHLPILDNLLPSRMSFELGACVAGIIAFGLDDLRRTRVTAGRQAVRPWLAPTGVAVLALVILVTTQLPIWPYPSEPAPALPLAISRAIPRDNPLAITYPYASGYDLQPMVWQLRDNFAFRLLGGYSDHPDANGLPILFPSLMSPPDLQQFLASQDGFNPYGRPLPFGPQLVEETRRTLTQYGIGAVIVDRSVSGSGLVVQLITEAMGAPKVSAGQFSLWLRQ